MSTATIASATAIPAIRATDSYPSAPQADLPFLGNGVYGNALLVSGTDTWYWDGSTWHHANAQMPQSPHTPPVYDPALKKSVVLTNGETGMTINTWAWTGTGWSDLQASPPGETGPSLLGYDAATQQLIGVVTATWRYDGSNWVQAGGLDSPQTRRGSTIVYDPVTRKLLLFGGIAYQNSHAVADTWTWDGKAWTQQRPTTSPPAGWASFAYDPDTKQVLLLDQEQNANGAPTNLSMWSWDGADWHEMQPSVLPPLGFKPTMIYDLANHQLIYFEDTFQSAPNGGGGSQTWTYTNGSWQRVG